MIIHLSKGTDNTGKGGLVSQEKIVDSVLKM